MQSATTVKIEVDGEVQEALLGQTVAAALLARGIRCLRRSPRARMPRGAFCMMGVCQECLVEIDGELAQACLVPVADGMVVKLDAAL